MSRPGLVLVAGLVMAAPATVCLAQQPKAGATCNPARDVFLVRDTKSPEQSGEAGFVLSKVMPDAGQGDVDLATVRGYYAANNDYRYDRHGRMFLYAHGGSPGTLHAYSICRGTVTKALQLEESRRIDSRYVGDGKTLTVTTSDNDNDLSSSNSRLEGYRDGRRLFSAEVSKESPNMASVHIGGVTPDVSMAYLEEYGADAGDVWGSCYRWDKTTNVAKKLGDLSSPDCQRGIWNPSATHAIQVRRGYH